MTNDYKHDFIDKMNSALTEDIQKILEKVLKARFEPLLHSLHKGQKEMLIGQAAVDKRLSFVEARLNKIEKEQKKQGQTIKKVQKTIDVMISAFNREDMQLRKRVLRIEENLGLSRLQ